jgi:hypothetical protein
LGSNIHDVIDWDPSVVVDVEPIPDPPDVLRRWPPDRATSNLGAVAVAPRYISMTRSSMTRLGRRVVRVKSRVTEIEWVIMIVRG